MSSQPRICRDCPAPVQRAKQYGRKPIYCLACKRRHDQENRQASRSGRHVADRRLYLMPDPPLAAEDPRDWFVLLLKAGWADTPGDRVPPDVRRDAEAGRTPRLHPKLAERRSA